MIVAVCVDNKGGMLFNRRRVSRDQAQQQDLIALCGEKPLWISSFSEKLFSWAAEQIRVDDRFLEIGESGETCFVEDQPLKGLEGRIEKIILYRWNRTYPSDMKLDLDFSGFEMIEQIEFPGASHDTITREIYVRK